MSQLVNSSNLVVQNYTPLYVAVIDPFETWYRKSAGFWRLRRNRNKSRRVSRKPVGIHRKPFVPHWWKWDWKE